MIKQRIAKKFHPVEAGEVEAFTELCSRRGKPCREAWEHLVERMNEDGMLDVCDVILGQSSGVTTLVVLSPEGDVRGMGAVGPIRGRYTFHYMGQE